MSKILVRERGGCAEGTVTLEIQLSSGNVARRHKDHVRPRIKSSTESDISRSSAVDAANTVPVSTDADTDNAPESSDQLDNMENASESESSSQVPESRLVQFELSLLLVHLCKFYLEKRMCCA